MLPENSVVLDLQIRHGHDLPFFDRPFRTGSFVVGLTVMLLNVALNTASFSMVLRALRVKIAERRLSITTSLV